MPIRAKASVKTASSAAMQRSQAMERLKPAPATGPCTAASVGSFSASSARRAACTGSMMASIAAAGSPSKKRATSPPAQNARPLATQQQGTRRAVPRDAFDRVRKAARHLRVDRIEHARTIERDGGDGLLDCEQHRAFGLVHDVPLESAVVWRRGISSATRYS
jgi:hypothetical protein